MTTRPPVTAVSALLALGLAGPAKLKSNKLPAGAVQSKASGLPSCAKAQTNRVVCRSAKYKRKPPPTAPRPSWDAMPGHLQAVFKPPVKDAAMPKTVNGLGQDIRHPLPRPGLAMLTADSSVAKRVAGALKSGVKARAAKTH